jgi:poly-gamma-glutamate capsule biosynthesis protein CapA/YwtB (metallophosphatase superfamily)
MNIALTGDVMLGRLVDRYVVQDAHVPPADVWGDVLPLLLAADLRLINLECVISTRGAMWHPRTKPFHFRAHPRAIDMLNAARIDCATLANNHILDYGHEALAECLDLLDQAGIRHAGAGRNLAEALAPAVLKTGAGSIAVIALTDNEPLWEATADRPGVQFVAYDTQGLIEPYRSRLRRLIAAMRAEAAFVIISAHVGPNWGAPSAAMRALAHELIDLGADLYWGHSNHAPQGMEVYHERLILYATGDFIDDYAVDPVERNDCSFLFVVELDHGRLQHVRLYPTVIDNLRVRRARGAEVRFLQERMRALSAALGSAVATRGDLCELAVR